MQNNPEHRIPRDAISAIGEASRSEAYKEARGKLVDTVNDWLRHQSELRDASGTPANVDPLITETDMGPTSESTHMIVEEKRAGQVLLGDPEELQPLVFQKVTHQDSGVVEVVQIQGTDPHFTMMYGDQYQPSSQTETIMAFDMREINPDSTEQRYRFEVRGNGGVYQQNTEQHGSQINVSRALHSVEEIQMSQLAFESLAQSLAETQ